MKYYFISFMYGASEKTLETTVTTNHPFEWEKDANKRHPGQYKIVDFKEITKEDYEAFKAVE